MGYMLADRLEVSVFINGEEYPLSAVNLLSSLHICATARAAVPLLTMQIKDVQHKLDTMGMQDGIPLRIVIAPAGRQSKTYNFRKFNHNKEQEGGSYTWTIFGYWDAPLYWNTTTASPFKGTSGELMAHIASTCGLKHEAANTNDNMLWMPQNMIYRAWAKDAAAHGWVSDQSCMALALDLDNTLRYVDVNNLPAPTKKVVAYTPDRDAYTAVDVGLMSGSGFNNAITGYQNTRIVQSIMNDAQTVAELQFNSKVKSPQYNIPLRDRLARGAFRFGPIDVGNVHQRYEQASYQNARYKNLFSLGLELLMNTPTDINLLENFTFSTNKENNDPDVVNSGNYLTTSHSLYVQGASYFEKLGVVRHGTNDKYVGG